MTTPIETLSRPLIKSPIIVASGGAGRASIASGSTAVAVALTAVAADSVVILTSNTDVASHIDLIATVGSQAAGVGFTVNVNKATVDSHTVAWWLVRRS